MRIHHWLKNLLLFVPVMLGGNVSDPRMRFRLSVAFIAFGLAASAGYLFNDLFDRENDRRHPEKSQRPIASGELSFVAALLGVSVLLCASLMGSTMIDRRYAGMILLYLAISLTYTALLKQLAVVDLLVLTILYLLRLLAGGIASETPVSNWLLGFSGFAFLSLGLIKRHAELRRLLKNGEVVVVGRGYKTGNLRHVEICGIVCSVISVCVLGSYAASDHVAEVYRARWPLVGIWLIIAMWNVRVWILARRGLISEDPVEFCFRDSVSWLCGVMTVLCVVFARSELAAF